MESVAIRNDARNSFLGPILGAVVAVTIMIGAFTVIALGESTVGIAAIVTAIVALAGVFVYGSESRRRERAEHDLRARKK